jgi:hypothetical protein
MPKKLREIEGCTPVYVRQQHVDSTTQQPFHSLKRSLPGRTHQRRVARVVRLVEIRPRICQDSHHVNMVATRRPDDCPSGVRIGAVLQKEVADCIGIAGLCCLEQGSNLCCPSSR